MHTPLRITAVLAALSLLSCGGTPHAAGTPAPLDVPTVMSAATPVLPGVVVGVIDGDTADVRLESGMIRIRFHGIDAPEMGQPYGAAAKARLAELVFGRSVSVEPLEQDRYDRLVARLWRGDIDVNAEMIKSGHAWAYRRYADTPAYCAYEKSARDQQAGLWRAAGADTIAPWEWRQRKTLGGHFTDYSAESVAGCVASLGK